MSSLEKASLPRAQRHRTAARRATDRGPVARWRPAELQDGRPIATLCRALYAEDPSSVPAAPRMQATLTRLRAEPWRGMAVVLEANRAIVGYALLITYWSNELGGELLALDEIYLVPGHRGQGYASDLIRALVSGTGPWKSRCPTRVIELEVSPGNTRARALYERLGFTLIRNATLRHRCAPRRRRA